MKKLPIGIQTFSTLIDEGYCYVDKTPLIYRLVESGRYYFLSRPRRFGKSLLVSTLKAAFTGERALFRGLFLEHNWDWSVRHPVIHLSFGGGSTESLEKLEIRMGEIIQQNLEQYPMELTSRSAEGRFAELIRRLHEQYRQKVVVLVDEYDKPILDNIVRADDATALAVREGLKSFYSVIKDSEAYLRFVLLTGVSKFSKVSLFSGLNNLEDITLSPSSATLCGYTESEIKDVFAEHLDGVDFDTLRDWYNGYNFLGESVYNPYDVLLYLKHRKFRNYWFEAASPSFLINLLQSRRYAIPDLEHIEAGEDLLSSFDVNRMEIEPLLFQTGYLTIKREKRLGNRIQYELTYPNQEVKASLGGSILNALAPYPAQQEKNLGAVYHALEQGEPDKLQAVFHAFFASIPNDWYRKNNLAAYEGYYASIVYCYFAALGLEVNAEESTDQGRVDLTVRLDKRVYVIEFKVVELEPGGKALAQIKAKRYFEKYLSGGDTVYLIGVEFSRDERNIVGFEWEVCA